MKIEERIDNAFAWSKQVLLDKLKKDKGDCNHKLTIIGQPQEQYDDMDLFDMAQHQVAADARGCR